MLRGRPENSQRKKVRRVNPNFVMVAGLIVLVVVLLSYVFYLQSQVSNASASELPIKCYLPRGGLCDESMGFMEFSNECRDQLAGLIDANCSEIYFYDSSGQYKWGGG